MDQLPKIVARIYRRLDTLKKKAATASREANLSSSAIYNLKRGAEGKIAVKGGNASTYAALAPVLRTSVQWLTTGKGPETVAPGTADRRILVKGYAGASTGHIYAVSDNDLDDIPPPEITSDTIAIEIRGDSLGPIFDRWHVLYDDRRDEVTDDMIGKLCVVGLPGDRVAVKVVQRAGGRRFNLLSQTGKDDIRNTAVEWAARVKIMVPR